MTLGFVGHMRVVPDHRIPRMATFPMDEVLLATLVGVVELTTGKAWRRSRPSRESPRHSRHDRDRIASGGGSPVAGSGRACTPSSADRTTGSSAWQLDGVALLVVGGNKLMDEALGVDPTERVIADAELASVVGDDAWPSRPSATIAPMKAASLVAAPDRASLRDRRVERAQVLHPLLVRAERQQSVAGEPVDDVLRQISAAHVGDRRRVDHITGHAAEQTTQESQARFSGPVRNAANRSEPM